MSSTGKDPFAALLGARRGALDSGGPWPPQPQCEFGYPQAQLEQMLGSALRDFQRWMNGQTMAVCDGRRYDHARGAYEPTGCGPHGPVVYSHDLMRYLAGLPVID